MADQPLPETVTVAVRLLPVVLEEALRVKVALPVPLVGLTVSHPWLLEAIQLHPLPVLKLTVVDPPQAGAGQLSGSTEPVQ